MFDQRGEVATAIDRLLPAHDRIALDPAVVMAVAGVDPIQRLLGVAQVRRFNLVAAIGVLNRNEKHLFIGSPEFLAAAILTAAGETTPITTLIEDHRFQFERRRRGAKDFASECPILYAIEAKLSDALNGARAEWFELTHAVLPPRKNAEAWRAACNKHSEKAPLDSQTSIVVDIIVKGFVAALQKAEKEHEWPGGEVRIVPFPREFDIKTKAREILDAARIRA